jgi:hypothetical protein
MPDELSKALEHSGAKNIKLFGPGALSRSIPGEVLANIMRDEPLKQAFLDFCFWYDSQPWCVGMGKDNLVAVADVWGANRKSFDAEIEKGIASLEAGKITPAKQVREKMQRQYKK